MAIRIRTVNGVRVALCAARSMPKEGDLYLDDGDHHALSVKFDLDIASMHPEYKSVYAESLKVSVMDEEESNNPNRTWWDSEYGENHALNAPRKTQS